MPENVKHFSREKLVNKVPSYLKQCTGIPPFPLLMWGHTQKKQKQKPHKSRLLSITKREENRIEL